MLCLFHYLALAPRHPTNRNDSRRPSKWHLSPASVEGTITVSHVYPGGESAIGKIEANLFAKWMFRNCSGFRVRVFFCLPT